MPRKSIYDRLEAEELNPSQEYRRLKYELTEKLHVFRVWNANGGYDSKKSWSLINYSAQRRFSFIECRGTSTTLIDMISRMGIDLLKSQCRLDDLFDLIELTALLADSCDAKNSGAFDDVIRSCEIILEKTAHKLIGPKGRRVVVPNNAIAEEAAEILCQTDPKTALELLKYNHRSNKGDIEAKRKILRNLGNAIEPLLDGQHKKDTEDTIGYIINNFNIRHNNENGKDKKEFFTKLSEREKELWYDRLYTSIVSLVIENEQRKINAEILAFRKNNE